jgi:hypothetical protein
MFPPTRSNALRDSFLGSLAVLRSGSLGRFKAPARSNADALPESSEGCVSAAGVVFDTRAGREAGFWVTLAG